MKKNLHIILTLCVGLLIGSSGSALASDTVQAVFAKFLLKINDQTPVEIEPLTYKGTTYLPVREAANKLGFDVTFLADSRTIVLTESVVNEGVSEVTEESTIDSTFSINEQISQLQSRIDSLNNQVSAWRSVLSSADETRKITIQAEIDDITRQINELRNQIADLESQLQQ